MLAVPGVLVCGLGSLIAMNVRSRAKQGENGSDSPPPPNSDDSTHTSRPSK
jgi:hypothetical protein